MQSLEQSLEKLNNNIDWKLTMHNWLIAILFMASTHASAAEIQCGGPLLELVNEGRDIYFGEHHGTYEIPMLLKCLVEERLKKPAKEPLIIALELDAVALNLDSDFWSGTDGRSSESMWNLVKFLLTKKQENKLTLHMLLENAGYDVIISEGQNGVDKKMGQGLHSITKKSQVLALSGNLHSRKSPMNILPDMIPAGSYALEMLHISIEATKNGEAWGCHSEGCGAHTIQKFPSSPNVANTLINGESFEHDYIYFVERFTVSQPHLVKKQRKQKN